MCGIAGIWSRDVRGLERLAVGMAERLSHRGPDASGVWSDEDAGIALTYRRLSILDLSENGAQPMHSEGGRFVISFNGEIYNHVDMRRELELAKLAPTWRGMSDTETLLAGFAAWGIEETIKRSVGMFAIAVWDRETRNLTLIRDRYGEKPLYFGTVGEGASSSFAFASELKALRSLPHFSNEIDRKSVAQMLQISVVAAPRTIYRGIHQLLPGHLVTMSYDDMSRRSFPQKPYWCVEDVASEGLSDPYANEDEALEAVHAALKQSIRGQMMADVPVGAFLSGGIDSSLIVALMQEQSARPVKTFTISFGKRDLDEAPYAETIAKHLGTDHTTIAVTDQDAMSVVPSLAEIYDEPFADSSTSGASLV